MNKLTRLLYVAGKAIVHAAIYGAFTTKNLASIGYLDGVQYLLRKSPDCAYKSDQDGFFPVHTASRKGHVQVIEFFLKQYPHLSELLNLEGQNILHVAVLSGKAKMVA
ncbi:protein accelerated cell death 6 [Quercus suber]|uniref:Protein accelerated cell death 6 n=1 Tax=Quercus suber TaxID=58331 RepID=A0AAW0IP54_QUESU